MKMLILLVCCGFCLSAAAGDSIEYRVATYVYKKREAEELRLDFYAPKEVGGGKSADGKRARPVIVLFHVGSWVSGDRSQMNWQCRYFVQQGILAITADYRLLGKDTGIVDAKSVLRWVRAHAGMLGIDTSKIILGGASAGGHLATMALLDKRRDDPGDDLSIPLSARALVLFNPAYSFADDPSVEPFGSAGVQLPPAVFFFGSRDKWKPAGDSLLRQMRGAGVVCKEWVAADQVHGFFNKAPWNRTTCEWAQAFLAGLGVVGRGAVAGARDKAAGADEQGRSLTEY